MALKALERFKGLCESFKALKGLQGLEVPTCFQGTVMCLTSFKIGQGKILTHFNFTMLSQAISVLLSAML